MPQKHRPITFMGGPYDGYCYTSEEVATMNFKDCIGAGEYIEIYDEDMPNVGVVYCEVEPDKLAFSHMRQR